MTTSPTKSVASTSASEKRRRTKVISIEDFDTNQRSGTLFNSPRTVLACAQEGIDQKHGLYAKNIHDFMLESKNDKKIAKIRLDHYLSRREEMLEVIRERRAYIIEATEERGGHQPSTSPRVLKKSKESSSGDTKPVANEEQPPKRASTPAVKSTNELLGKGSESGLEGTAGNSHHHNSHHHGLDLSDDDSETSSMAEERREREAEDERKRRQKYDLTPEAYMKREEEAKKQKVMRQVDKMKRVMEKNRQREEQKQEYQELMHKRYIQQEQERQEEREREEIARYLRERAQKKREAELAVQREAKEQATLAKLEALKHEREERARAIQEREEDRKRQQEIRRLENDLEIARKREMVAQRNQQIQDQAQQVLQERRDLMDDKMRHVEEQRQRLLETRDKELAERKAYAQRMQEENARKRQQAENQHQSKITGYKEKGAEAERKRQKLRSEREQYMLYRHLQEEEKDRHRKEILETVNKQIEAKSQELAVALAREERRAKKLAEARDKEARLRAVEKEIVVEDRVAAVRRLQLRKEHECREAEERYEMKMDRIARMKAEMKEMEQHRKRLLADAMQQGSKPAAATLMTAATPGPGEYRVGEAEAKLLGLGPGVKMGNPPRRKTSPLHASAAALPGPGQYELSLTAAIRPQKGAKLPPRHQRPEELENDLLYSKSVDGGSVSRPSRARSQNSVRSTAGDSSLPAIHRNRPPRAATSLSNKTKARNDRPVELREEDFATDDDFEDV